MPAYLNANLPQSAGARPIVHTISPRWFAVRRSSAARTLTGREFPRPTHHLATFSFATTQMRRPNLPPRLSADPGPTETIPRTDDGAEPERGCQSAPAAPRLVRERRS